MKKLLLLIVITTCLIVSLSHGILAKISGAEVQPMAVPMLITNAGQGPGGKMGRLLVSQSKTITLNQDFWYNAEPDVEDLRERPYQTLMVVIGSSAKGLGASGITIDQEITRLERMIGETKRLGLYLIAVHLEGGARRGKPGSADERSIDAIAPFADYLIVAKESDQDGRFTKIASDKQIPLTFIDSAIDFMQVAKIMFAD